MRFYALLVVAVVASPSVGTARAAEKAQACAQAYEKAQEEKTASRLRNAIGYLKTCVAPACPSFIREDCVRWMNQTEMALPSVVFSVREDGRDQTDVKILYDNHLLTGKLDGKAVPVDPGLHEFIFSVPGHAPIARQVLVREGERNRAINVEFDRPVKILPLTETSSSSTERERQEASDRRSERLVSYAFGGAGVLGIAGFTAFAILGNNQQRDLERTCSPYCQTGQVDSVKTKYLLADVSLGVGLVSLGVATYLWVRSRGSDAAKPETATSIHFVPRFAGGVLQLSTSY